VTAQEEKAMLASQWSPWREMQTEMNRLQNEVNRMFGRYGAGNGRTLAPTTYPAMIIWEDDNHLFVETELPGMELDQLEIFVNGGNQLTLKGERRPPAGVEGQWHRRERGYGKFARVIELPNMVDTEKVEAHFKHGVLTLTLPKQESSKPRKIEVKAE